MSLGLGDSDLSVGFRDPTGGFGDPDLARRLDEPSVGFGDPDRSAGFGDLEGFGDPDLVSESGLEGGGSLSTPLSVIQSDSTENKNKIKSINPI